MAKTRLAGTILFILALAIFLFSMENVSAADVNNGFSYIFGKIQDAQLQPVEGVEVSLVSGVNSNLETLSSALTQADGSYAIKVPLLVPKQARLNFSRHHFQQKIVSIPPEDLTQLQLGNSVSFPLVTLEREITPAFWIAALIFVIVLVLIATGFLHNTLAAFAGASVLLAISYLGSPFFPDLYIFNFPQAITYIDWNVIFLIMGMMMVIAVVENTGIFHWLSYHAYRISGGKMIILLPVLMLITGISSAFLDNVTTMLLMTPITVQIALALNISPLILLIPEVFASNVIGVSTLIGTPTNILIGSFGNITFNDFLTNLTPGVFLAFLGLVIYSWLTYRKELTEEKPGSPLLLKKLEERGKITNPENLKKAGWIGVGMMLLFIFGEKVDLLPSVTALIGASALLIWIRPDIDEMIGAVDWTTLVFFMSLFIVVGAIQEVGLISAIATMIGELIGLNLILAMIVVTWFSAILSMVIANIPFTAAMLPVIAYLTLIIPGAESKVLFYCLSIGAAMGGNGSLIGASANMITAGIAERAGYKITYKYFMKKGFPALVITVSLALLWLFIRF
ncbi:MAG: citrate transporter [Chloroflexota bacterium]|nr:MAG: citrate transporter [Chloroflexota bacterium]HDD61647.1 citrate transporter [Chloroflexota bacterium]